MLASNMDLVGSLSERVDELIKEQKIDESQRRMLFNVLCMRRGEAVFNEYHGTLPTLKPTVYRASEALKTRGYVFNAYGRERRLPEKAAFRAFNSIIQSTAADVMKERTVAVAPRYNKEIRDLGITISASVHDETLFNFPDEIAHDERLLVKVKHLLEDTEVKFRVPIRSSCGRSSVNWKIAGGDDGELKLNENI